MTVDPLTYRAVCYARRIVMRKFAEYQSKKPGKHPSKKTMDGWLLAAWDAARAKIAGETRRFFPWDYSYRRAAWHELLTKEFAHGERFRPGFFDTLVEIVVIQHHNAGSTPLTDESAFKRFVKYAWRRAHDANMKDAFPIPYEKEIVYQMLRERVLEKTGHTSVTPTAETQVGVPEQLKLFLC